MTPLPALVAAYLRHAASQGDADFRAWEEVRELVLTQPEVAWPLVLALIDQAPTPAILGYIAAGPLEELISAHGAQCVDRIEEETRRSPRFRQALAGVWGWSSIPRALRERFGRIPGLNVGALPPRSDKRARKPRRGAQE